MTENFMMLQLTLGRHDERVRGKGTKLLPKGEDFFIRFGGTDSKRTTRNNIEDKET